MKIKSVVAVGAMGAGLGLASFIGGTGTASAECNQATTPIVERIQCLTNADLAAFGSSIDPATQLDILINGNDDDTDFGSLGLAHQPATFVNSLVGEGGFFSGPISSQDQPTAPAPEEPTAPAPEE